MHLLSPSTFLLFLSWLPSSVVAGPISPRDDADWPRDAPRCQKNDVYGKGVGFSHNELYDKDGLCVTRWDEGVLPRRIYAEAKEDGLRKIEIEWTDGEKKVSFGTNGKKENSGVLEWSPLIDKWEYLGFNQEGWKGGIGRMVGKLTRIIEEKTTTLDAGGHKKDKLAFQPDIGKGVLIGFKIRAGDLVDYIEPMFTNTGVKNMALRNMKFTPSWEELNDLPFSDQQMQLLDIGHAYTNRVNASARLIIDASFNVRRSTEVNFAETKMREKHGNVDLDWFPIEVEGKIGIPYTDIGWDMKWKPDLIKGGYKQMDMKSKMNGNKQIESEQSAARVRAYQTVPALSSVTCITALMQSDVTLDFTGDMVWIFEDGKEHKYQVKGVFKNANFANAVTDCFEMTPEEFERTTGYKPSSGVWNAPKIVEQGDNPGGAPMDDHGDDDGMVDDMRKRDLPSYVASENSRVIYDVIPEDAGAGEGQSDGNGTPQDTPPQKKETVPPVDGTAHPVDDTAPPFDGTAPPNDGTAPPVDKTAPPLDDTAPPVDDTAPPVDDVVTDPASGRF